VLTSAGASFFKGPSVGEPFNIRRVFEGRKGSYRGITLLMRSIGVK
jgi:hypothetical protein